MYAHKFAHEVLPVAASNRFLRRASLPVACALRGELQKWACVRADTLRSRESAFVCLLRQFSSPLEGRGGLKCDEGGQVDAPLHLRATVPAILLSVAVCPEAHRGARANTSRYQR